MKKFGNILWGIAFILVGIIIGGNALGLTNINIFFNGWWTLFIIVPCFIGFFRDDEKTGSIIGLLIGVALLLACRDILEFDIIWKLIFPLILIIIGLSFLLKETFGGKINNEIKELNKSKNASNEYCAIFSGQDAKFDDEEFKRADLTAIFGGVNCDIRKAIIKEDVVINATSIFGGVDLYVPDNIKVKIKATPIFGGVSNKKEYNTNQDSHTVYINATCIFGGVELK